METSYLSLDHLSYAYHGMHGETCALTDISFSVKKGEFIAIVGPSGCGKSTLLSLIAGLLTPESGKILFPMLTADENPKIGYMLQRDHLFEWRTIYKNVILGLEINHLATPEKLAKVEAYLKDYGLWDFRDKRPGELSGGMKQRAALIRTLALEPELLLLDEPFSAGLPDQATGISRHQPHYPGGKKDGASDHSRSVGSHLHCRQSDRPLKPPRHNKNTDPDPPDAA